MSTDEEIGLGTAKQVEIKPQKVEYIEARGYLGHELLIIFHGNIEFVRTSNLFFKFLESFLPICPIIRWYPSANSELYQVGYSNFGGENTKIYLYLLPKADSVLFFVDFTPESPAYGWYIKPFHNMPKLDTHYVVKPPFNKTHQKRIDELLRSGVAQRFQPLVTEDCLDKMEREADKIRKAMWEYFNKKTGKKF